MDENKGNEKKYKNVYAITEKPGYKKAFWTKCGIAMVNQDQSINLYLDAVPLTGKLQIRERDEENGRRWSQRDGQEAAPPSSFDFGGSIQ